MNKNNRIDKLMIFLVIVLIFTGSFGVRCARQSSPIGGPMDTIPPIILKLYPANYQTNLFPTEVVFEFNEFMKISNQQKEIIVSPPLEVKPSVELRGKKIYTHFPYDLKLDSNTTYHIDYGNALVDINEGNPAKQVKYIFSTGDKIDSLSMSGQAIDAKTGDTLINALVFMYDDVSDIAIPDSTLFTGKIRAMAKTDSTGVYFATNLKGKGYSVYVVEDADGNGAYTVGKERVGFIDSALNPLTLPEFKIWFDPISMQTYASPQVKFRMFMELENKIQGLEEVISVGNYKFLIRFASPNPIIDTVIIDSLSSDALLFMPSQNKDSMYVWVKKRGFEVPDTLKGIVKYMGRDTAGLPALVDYAFEIMSHTVTEEELDQAKKALKENKTPWWRKVLDWFRFRHRRQIKLEKRRIALEHQMRLDSLKDNPEALLKLRLDSLHLDSLRVDSLRLDSLLLDSLERFKVDSVNFLSVRIDPVADYNPNHKIYISTDFPLDTVILDSIKLYKFSNKSGGEDDFNEEQAAKGEVVREKTLEKLILERDSLDFTKFRLLSNWMEDSEYELNVPPATMVDITGLANDTLKHTFKTAETRKTAIINIEAEGVDQCYILELVNGSVVETIHIVKKDSTYHSKLLPLGAYKIKVTKDDNCNGKFDDGNLIKRIMPEEIAFHQNSGKNPDFETKANFEFNIKVNFKALFSKTKELDAANGTDSLGLDSLKKDIKDIQLNQDSLTKVAPKVEESVITSNNLLDKEHRDKTMFLAILQSKRNNGRA